MAPLLYRMSIIRSNIWIHGVVASFFLLCRACWQSTSQLFGILKYSITGNDAYVGAVHGRNKAHDLYFFYDLEANPTTYDVTYFLVAAEMISKEKSAAGFIFVVVPGKGDGLRREAAAYEAIIDKESRWWRVNNMVVPIAELSKACRGIYVAPDREHAARIQRQAKGHIFPEGYSVTFPKTFSYYPHVFKRARSPGSFQGLRASPQGLSHIRTWVQRNVPSGCKLVTMTLRQYRYMPQRNNSLPDWADFARRISGEGYYPVFILDTEAAFDGIPEEIREFAVFSEISWNLALRMALYECAYMNLFVVNGPLSLCQLNPVAPYMCFKLVLEDSPDTTVDHYRDTKGITVGETPAFATSRQRWVWRSDDRDVLYEEFSAFVAEIEENAEV